MPGHPVLPDECSSALHKYSCYNTSSTGPAHAHVECGHQQTRDDDFGHGRPRLLTSNLIDIPLNP